MDEDKKFLTVQKIHPRDLYWKANAAQPGGLEVLGEVTKVGGQTFLATTTVPQTSNNEGLPLSAVHARLFVRNTWPHLFKLSGPPYFSLDQVVYAMCAYAEEQSRLVAAWQTIAEDARGRIKTFRAPLEPVLAPLDVQDPTLEDPGKISQD